MSRPISVLLVEDDDVDARIVTRLLRGSTHAPRLEHVSELRSAIDLLPGSFDVLLLDLGLPDADDDSVEQVRSVAPTLPIVVLTGDECDDTGEHVLRAGAEDYLPKSELSASTLRRVLRHAVERARLREDAARQREHRRNLERMVASHERLAAVGRLASGVAHEINNPAAFISANLETSQRLVRSLEERLGPFDPALLTLRECIEESAIGIERVASIVQDLRTFARPNREDVELVRLEDVLETCRSVMAGQFRQDIRLEVVLDPTPEIAAHRGKLVAVVSNLLMNAIAAIQSSPTGRGTVRVETASNAGEVILAVTDTGEGIPEALHDRVFEPFFTTKGRQGTGLGLSLSLEVAKAHRGYLELESEVGRGTRVTLRLPRDTGLRAPVTRLVTEAPEDRPAVVLVVDDEPLVLKSVERLLGRDYEVLCASGAQEAQAIVSHASYVDVLLCDLGMPETDGTQLYEQLCERDPSWAERILFFTGGAVTSRIRSFLRDHAVPVIRKPARRRELESAIRRITHRATPGAGQLAEAPALDRTAVER